MSESTRSITTEMVVAYSQCPTKAFLLLDGQEPGTPHEYVSILEKRKHANQARYIEALLREEVDVQGYDMERLKNGSRFLVNATLRADGLEATCGVLTKVRAHSELGRYSYEPTTFTGTHMIGKEDRLELSFVAHLLGEIQGRPPAEGRIIGFNGKSHRVKLDQGVSNLLGLLAPLQKWAGTSSPEPPPLALNKHCPLCPFQDRCKEKARQEDNMSLLGGVTEVLGPSYRRP